MMIVLMKFSVTIWLYKDSDFKGFTEVSWPSIYQYMTKPVWCPAMRGFVLSSDSKEWSQANMPCCEEHQSRMPQWGAESSEVHVCLLGALCHQHSIWLLDSPRLPCFCLLFSKQIYSKLHNPKLDPLFFLRLHQLLPLLTETVFQMEAATMC